MILPSLEFENIYNRNNFFKGQSIAYDTKLRNHNNTSLNENPQLNYFKQRATSKANNESDSSPISMMRLSKQNVNVRRKLSPLNNDRTTSNNRMRSPRHRQDFEDKTSKDISEIILLLLN